MKRSLSLGSYDFIYSIQGVYPFLILLENIPISSTN